MLELHPADVLVGLAHEGDDDADVADGNLRHRHLLHPHEPGIQVPGAREEHLLLQPAAAAAVEEALGVLEAVVAGDRSGPAISPSSMGAPSRVVTMPTLSGSTW